MMKFGYIMRGDAGPIGAPVECHFPQYTRPQALWTQALRALFLAMFVLYYRAGLPVSRQDLLWVPLLSVLRDLFSSDSSPLPGGAITHRGLHFRGSIPPPPTESRPYSSPQAPRCGSPVSLLSLTDPGPRPWKQLLILTVTIADLY